VLQNVYQQSTQCLVEDMDGELLIYNPESATTLHLNGPSMVVWNCCNGSASVQDIVVALQEAFPQQAEQISADVVNVFKEFSENQIVQLAATSK
jgi:hypothetical protein